VASPVNGDQGDDATVAAAGFTAFALAVAVSRLAGDRALARVGRRAAVRTAGLVPATEPR
jgi:hypothetical protein